MTTLIRTAPTAADIRFLALSAHEWRVSDSRFPPHSIEALLGFVARHGSIYYATRMDHPLDTTPFPSLERVAEFFASEGDHSNRR